MLRNFIKNVLISTYFKRKYGLLPKQLPDLYEI